MMKMTKRDVKERHRAKVERELLFSMKVSLDLLMKAKVKDPEVVGFLVRGIFSPIDVCQYCLLLWWVLTYALRCRIDSRIEIFTLSIQHEALYIPRLLGIMKIPRDHTDFECIEEGLPAMLAAKVHPFPSCALSQRSSCSLLIDDVFSIH
jgi:hypothetical protein